MTENERIREVKTATILRFTDIWRNNFQTNLPRIRENPGVAALRNKFPGAPCIVIGAGPSLDKNIRYLPHVAGKAILIASDAALKPLLQHDVIPAFVVCLDPQEEIARFLAGVSHRGMTLVAPSIVHPHVLNLWEESVVFYHKYAPDIPILVEIQNSLPHIGVLTPGGSVLSVAYDLAFQMGGSPIMFIGQDLAFPKKNLYTRGCEKEEVNLEHECTKQSENIVFEENINGVGVPTLKALSVTKQWFNWAFTTWKREYPLEIYNCSEAGILKDHCQIVPLREAMHTRCTKKLNVAWTLKKALR